MAEGRFISYYRVSTLKQGASGLGLEAQQAAVQAYLNGGNWTLLDEFQEIESGKNNARPVLARAIYACRLKGATLVIAKLDRLSRDAHFLLGLQRTGVDFVCADMPVANRLTVGIMAVVAEEERHMISKRTKDALAAAKARGSKLGGYRGGPVPDGRLGAAERRLKADQHAALVLPTIAELRQQDMSLHQVAAALAERGVRTPRGGAWTATSVRRVLARSA
jgi:DNA invertase Pin-like site-specific DNA recombinase